ncbi:MAG TPA: acyltransferase [Beijerinckiaceae bacterium]|nr:acyltransferase [Beijerinckiaceae bacterium]
MNDRTSAKIPGYRPLGTFRFFLALLVLAQHFTNIAPHTFAALVVPLRLGSLAVLVFFAVSGFVIAEAVETHYRGRPGAFLANRAIRIYPPLLAAFALMLLVLAGVNSVGPMPHPEPWQPNLEPGAVFSGSNLIANLLSFLPAPKVLGEGITYPLIIVAWSIRVEFLFYLVMAAALILPAQWYRPSLVAAGLLALMAFVVHTTGRGPEMLQFMPYFVYGVALYFVVAGARFARPVVLIALTGCAVQALLDTGLNGAAAGIGNAGVDIARVLILAACLLLLPILAREQAGRFRATDQALGDLSYPLYLNHCVLLPVVRSLAPDASVAGLLGATVAAVALSYLMLLAVEPVLTGLRDRIRGSAPALLPMVTGRQRPDQLAKAPLR